MFQTKYYPAKTQQNMGNKFPWLEYVENYQGVFCKVCRKSESQSQTSSGVWITKPFQNWKRMVQKKKAHTVNEAHIRHVETELLAKKRRVNHMSFATCWESREARTEMLSSHFFVVLISYVNVNSTFLSRQTWIS